MKILNLDKLGGNNNRQVVIFGKTYVVAEMTVGNFIETTRAAEALENETSVAKQIEETVAMVIRSIPDVDVADLQKLSLEQLRAIVAFIRGDDVDGAVEEEGGDKKKE